jgi:hypothetical protein
MFSEERIQFHMINLIHLFMSDLMRLQIHLFMSDLMRLQIQDLVLNHKSVNSHSIKITNSPINKILPITQPIINSLLSIQTSLKAPHKLHIQIKNNLVLCYLRF